MAQDLFDQRYNIEVPQELIDTIHKTFPEGDDINPEFISPDKDTNIHLLEAAELSVTFVHEGAGYRNSFGYFTYELDESENVVNMSELNYIYNNASLLHSGGDLLVGDTVDLGLFPADTRIGWFLGADEFRGGTKKFYSHDFMNEDNQLKHTCAVFDLDFQSILYGFEDTWGGGDRDYNDLMWYVVATPWTAVNRSKMASTDELTTITSNIKSRCSCI